MLDARSTVLFKTLVERYISEGQPVGSRTLSKHSGLELSPATVRNVMVDLEEAGFVSSPHTSAGRIPTALGYRLFVDNMLTVRPLVGEELTEISGAMQPDQPDQLISKASQLLSGLSHFAGIVMAPRHPTAKIRQIEFLGLSERRTLLIIVSADGDVQNRILHTEKKYSQKELTAAANYLNEHFSGLDFGQIQARLQIELENLKNEIRPLVSAALSSHSGTSSPSCVISGERNLLDVEDFTSNISLLRQLFDLFDKKASIARLLRISQEAEGVQIFIGHESGLAPLDECSVVVAPYEVDGQVVGSVGVIGPTRMAYERVISLVDITARLLSSALSEPSTSIKQRIDDNDKKAKNTNGKWAAYSACS